MTERRVKLEALLKEDPQDTFLRYGIAMEYAKEGNAEEALARLQALTAEQPPFVPAFFMAAQQLAPQNVEAARTFLRDGIEAARSQGDNHAAGEMSEFLASLGTN